VPSLDDLEVAPTVSAAESLSPSALNSLLACPRRLAYSRDPNTRTWSRPTPRTALGVVAHALTEAAATKDLPEQTDERSAWLETRWDLLVAEQVDRLATAWPNRAVPPPSAWPGYAITKVRLIRRLTRDAPDRANHPGQSSDLPGTRPSATTAANTAPPLPWVERTLQSDHPFGTPDLVEEVGGELRVVDLKAGVHQHEPTPDQRRQLLVYAGLVQAVLGRLPDVCVIRDARGAETTINVSEPDVDKVRGEAEVARQAFNSSLTSPRGAPAVPSKENCRWCDFRIVCSEYWRNRESDWPSTAGDTVGTVTSTSPPYTQIQLLDRNETHRVILGPYDETGADGDLLVLVNTERAGFQTSRPRWDSHVRVVPANTES
jgi:CRISPR/Cas system-associated exonuclease Cas4 (RecB family)